MVVVCVVLVTVAVLTTLGVETAVVPVTVEFARFVEGGTVMTVEEEVFVVVVVLARGVGLATVGEAVEEVEVLPFDEFLERTMARMTPARASRAMAPKIQAVQGVLTSWATGGGGARIFEDCIDSTPQLGPRTVSTMGSL